MKRYLIDAWLLLWTLAIWFALFEVNLGTLSSIAGYYLGEYDARVPGWIVESRLIGGGGSRKIAFAYMVGGKVYVSEQVSFTSRMAAPRTTLQKYPKGRRVTVHYDASRPELSVLEPTPLGMGVWLEFVFVGLPVAGVLAVLLPLRITRKCRHRRPAGTRPKE